jgi:glycosyltransferase involved in cell wall biosynthesis
MSNTIIVSVSNDLCTDQRVHKVCSSLVSYGYNVHLVGFKSSKSLELNRAYRTHRFKIWFSKGPLFYAEFSIKLFFYLLFNKSDHLLSNDLDTLLPNYLVSKLKRQSLVFDAHEIFSDSPELQGRPLVKSFWQYLEAFLMPRVSFMYTVCDSLATHYRKKLKVEMEVVRNVPVLVNKDTPALINKVLLFQGNMNLGRGLGLAIEALVFLPDYKLIIVGAGFDYLKPIAIKHGVLNQIEFVGVVPFEMLKHYTEKASIGILLEEPIGLSFTYSLPNKLFDYIHSNLKIIASPLSEVKRIIDQYDVGVILKERNPKSLAAQIIELENKTINLDEYARAKKDLNWGKEQIVLKNIFEKLKK